MVDRYKQTALRRYSIDSENTVSSAEEGRRSTSASDDAISEDELDADTTQVELSLECHDLADMDVFSLSDAFVVAYVDRGRDGVVEIGRTETVWNNLNPQFVTTFIVEHSGASQKVRFDVYDQDAESDRLEKHDFIGRAELTLDDLRDAPAHRLKLKLQNPDLGPRKDPGYISVCAEKVNKGDPRALVEFRIAATRLRKKGVNITVAQFYTISRAREEADGSISFSPIYRSEAVNKGATDGSGYAKFKAAILTVRKLVNGPSNRPLRITVYRHKRSGRHQMVGYAVMTLSELKSFDPKRKPCVIPLEGLYADEESLGNVILTKKSTDRHRVTFEMKIDHFIGAKYVSSPVDSSKSEIPDSSFEESSSMGVDKKRSARGSGAAASGRISRRLSSARAKFSNLSIRK